MDPTALPEPHNPGSHCYVVNDAGRQRLGLMVTWGQRAVPGGKRGVTEHHANVYYLDLDDETGEWVTRHEWVHASRIIGAGSGAVGVHATRQA